MSAVLWKITFFEKYKQNWHLEYPPKKTKEGVYIQTYTTMAMKALTTAFLKWQEEQLQLEALGKENHLADVSPQIEGTQP